MIYPAAAIRRRKTKQPKNWGSRNSLVEMSHCEKQMEERNSRIVLVSTIKKDLGNERVLRMQLSVSCLLQNFGKFRFF